MTPFYTALALTAFAANSILCRLALGGRTIDAASFTTIRLVSGAAMLLAITAMARRLRRPPSLPGPLPAALDPLPLALDPLPAALDPLPLARGPSPFAPGTTAAWRAPLALVAYAIAFSFAYLNLTTGTGALILFGAVQTTMIGHALASGERPRALEWVGLASALSGLVVLVLPGLSSPPLVASLVMAGAGLSWGFYSLWGLGAGDPLAATTENFARSVPLALAVSLLAVGGFHASAQGALLAVSSGALASGLGYVVWYAALRGLSATRAAIVQSATPVFTAAGGVVFLSEQITIRLVAAAVLILGGIGLAVAGRR